MTSVKFAHPAFFPNTARPRARVPMKLLVKTVTRSGEHHSIRWVECEPVRRPAPSLRVRVLRVSVSLPRALAGPQLPARPAADRQCPRGEEEAGLQQHFSRSRA